MPTYEITTESGKVYQIETEGVSKPGKKTTTEKVASVLAPFTSAGKFLGLDPLGSGLGASVLGQLLPSVRKARAAQEAETQAVANLPAETLRRMAREGKSIQESGAIRDLEQGTTQDLTNKQVVGSALSTALLATGGSLTGGLAKGGVGLQRGAQLSGGLEGLIGSRLPQATSALGRAGVNIAKQAPGSALLGGGQAGAIATAQNKSVKEIQNATMSGAIIGGLIPVGIESTKLALRGASKVSGLLTQQGSKQTQEVFERGKAGQADTLKQFKGQTPTEIARAARDAVDTVRDARNKLYQRDFSKLNQNGVIDITPAKKAVTKKLINDIGAKITPPKKAGLTLKDGILTPTKAQKEIFSLKGSKLDEGAKGVVEEVYNSVNTWDDFSVKGVDSLQQKLSRIAFKAPMKSAEKQFAIEAQNQVKKLLDKNVPGYSALTQKYAETSKAIEFAEEVLNLRKKKGTGDINLATAINKISNVLKDNQAREIQYEALKEMSKRSGVDLIGMVLAQNAKRVLPQGFLGQGLLVGTGAIGATPGGVALLPALIKAGLITSPAVASQAALRAGQAAGLAERTGAGQATRAILPQLLGGLVQKQ